MRPADVVLGASLVLFVAVGLGPRLGTYRTVTMLTDSMRPGIPAGSVVVLTRSPASRLEAGQVITFEAPVPDRRVVTHRVVGVRRHAGQVMIRTKGDANSAPDPWTAVVRDRTVWRVRAVVPHAGTVLRAVRRAGALVAFVPLVLVVPLLRAIWRPRRALA